MNKKTIIFDADGTLLNSLWVWDNLVLSFLKERNLAIQSNLHKTLWSMSYEDGIHYIKYKYNLKESFEEIREILQSRLKISYENFVTPFENVDSLLCNLKSKNYYILVASASDKELLKLCFKNNKILQYFDSVITERDYNKSKANKAFFTRLIEDYKLNPSNTILIDDALHSLKSAKKSNIKTIGIVNGKNKELFIKYCDLAVDSIGELNEESINNCWK